MLIQKTFFFVLILFAETAVFAQTNHPEALPLSQIDIPIQINLKPFYALAERNVDTVFTSPNYPEDWVQADCATRYKYRFRRSPLRMSVKGTTLDLSFTGFYQISGSTRFCTGGGTVLSPWTPSCNCGFAEGERKVAIGFTSTFNLQPNYVLQTKIVRKEPVAQDKCEVCFWGQDVTKDVLDGLKKELDASKKAMEDSFSVINLKPYLQQAWNLLNDAYTIPGIGTFRLNPKNIRMQNLSASNDLLNMSIGITASPVVSFIKAAPASTPLPDLTAANSPGGFSIFLEAALQYDSLSRVVNGYMAGKRFDLSEGLFARHIVVDNVTLAGNSEGNLLIKLDFSGSFNGSAFFNGRPTYNAATQTIEVQNLDYDLQTKNLLLKTAKWLFNGKIESELKKAASIPLGTYFASAQKSLNGYLNREWAKGIKGSGTVKDLHLVSAEALPQHLLIKTACAGDLRVQVSEINLNFNR
ncbi:DUF4403 family protein [Flavisolibacter nicotianae]|uniref:DUF4403 family protein n=1 Tax=Flavisolibacter nicotianae TaxID=2364882 RepID=UPI0013C4CEA5|nr:DUF4403 family protein [Flavisolibacter nicotianae]